MRLDRILFLDIETVPAFQNYTEIPEKGKYFWKRKARRLFQKDMEDLTEEELYNSYFERSGIYAEFAKIVCISVGYYKLAEEGKYSFRTKSFSSHDEGALLKEFCALLEGYFNQPREHALCGHNLKEFDVPFICRRLLINKLPFPKLLQIQGKKPWETPHLLDTMEMWKFGDRKMYTSLDLLAHIFNIPSPKDDIDGSLVGRVYWEDKDLERIRIYCEKDVETTAKVWQALSGIELPLALEEE